MNEQGKKAEQKRGQYQDYPEVCTTKQMAELIGTCDTTLRAWTKLGTCDMGEIIQGVHYYSIGDNKNYIKDRMCELFGILPKQINQGMTSLDTADITISKSGKESHRNSETISFKIQTNIPVAECKEALVNFFSWCMEHDGFKKK